MPEEGRVLLVTGASGGVGPYVVERLLKRGDRLVLMARDGGKLEQLASRVGADGNVATYTGAAQDPADSEAAVALAVERFGKIEGLVALAGAFAAGMPVALAEPDAYTSMYEANMLTAAVASRAVLLRLTGPGWFVYLSSALAREPMPTMGPYAASKAALHAWARAFSKEVSAREVRVNILETTLIDTPKHREEQPGADYSLWVPVEDIAGIVAFMTSDAAGSMYGGVVPVPGRFGAMAGGGPPGGGPPGGGPPGGGPPQGPPEPPPLPEGAPRGGGPDMSDEVALVYRYYNEVFNEKRLDRIEEFLSPDIVDTNPGADAAAGGKRPPGLEQIKGWWGMVLQAFPDLEVEFQILFGDGDLVIENSIVRGTHEGQFMMAGPTGRKVAFDMTNMYRISSGKIVERWGAYDTPGLMGQLGMVRGGPLAAGPGPE